MLLNNRNKNVQQRHASGTNGTEILIVYDEISDSLKLELVKFDGLFFEIRPIFD